MKLKKILARVMVFVFSLNLIYINVNAEENKVLNEDNAVYQLAKTGVKYAAIGCCFAFGFYTFKHVKHKTKHIIKNMRKKLKSDSCSSCRSNSDDSSIYSIINVDTNSNSTYQRSSLRNSSFIDRNRYNNNGGNLKRSVSFGYLALQQNNDFNDEVKSPLIV